MTVASEISRSGPYNGNGVTKTFAYDFRILDAAHIQVIRAAVDGTETTLTLTADYTVSGVGNAGGGSITATVAPASGQTITILRKMPFTQETDLENQGAYYAQTIEDALDAAAMRDQELDEQLQRAIKIPASLDNQSGEFTDQLAINITRLAQSADEIDIVAVVADEVDIVAGIADDVSAVAAAVPVLQGTASAVRMNESLFTGDGATTTFTLGRAPGADENVFVWVGGAIQTTTDYDVSGTTLTILTAPANGVPIRAVVATLVSANVVEALRDEVAEMRDYIVALVGTYGGNLPVASRAAMKAVDTNLTKAVTLMEGVPAANGRMGLFVWMTGNFSTQVDADPQEGLFIASSLPGRGKTVGAWVRIFSGAPNVGMWGATVSASDNRVALQAAIDAVSALYPTWQRQLDLIPGTLSYSRKLTIPSTALGFTLCGYNFRNFQLNCTDLLSDEPAIDVLCSEFKMFGLGLLGNSTYTGAYQDIPATITLSGGAVTGITCAPFGDFDYAPTIYIREGSNLTAQATAIMTDRQVTGFTVTNGGAGYTAAAKVSFIIMKAGLRIYRGPTETLDYDAVVSECRINTFYHGIDMRGRGLILRDCIVSQVNYGLSLSWPDFGRYLPNWRDIPATINRSGGLITSITLGANFGSFNVPPKIYVRDGVNDANQSAVVTANLTGSAISSFTVANGGSGYTASAKVSYIDPVQDQDGGFRGILVRDCRFHTLNYAAVANIGANGNLLHGFTMADCVLDIGRRIFYGHMGDGCEISGCISKESTTEIFEIWGGVDCIISNITGGGSGKNAERAPDNIITLLTGPYSGSGKSGTFTNCAFSDLTLSNCEEHAIRDSSVKLDGVSFDNIRLRDIGYNVPASWRGFSFGSQNGMIQMSRITLMGADTLESVIGSNFSNNAFIIDSVETFGNSTPHFGGSSAAILNMRTDEVREYTPAVNPAQSGTVNLTSVSFPAPLQWSWVGKNHIRVWGQVVVQAAAAGAVLFYMPLPKPSNFTTTTDAGGMLNGISGTPAVQAVIGNVIAVAATDDLQIRLTAESTNGRTFWMDATYRVK